MIGQTLGRYIIESKLGEGGMGVVYKARDTQLDRTVAIKILPADRVSDPDRKRRFVQEAKAASALNHPGIITIHDIGSDAGRDFIVMEYVQGATLDRLTPPGGLKLTQALRHGVAITDALSRAHEAGIVHRDLKPSNIMVTDDGRIKVLDFGLAKLLEPAEASASMTTVAQSDPGSVVGTTAYMSPEQAEGRKLDARSDIFSFGSVLYEMLTARRAFAGESRLSVLSKIVSDEPTPPTALAPAVPIDVEKAVLRCLRKDPGRRYQTMADLKVALEDLIEDSSSRTSPAPVPSTMTRSRVALMMTAALVALLAIGAYVWTRPQSATNEAPAQAVPLTSLPGSVRQPALSPNGDHVAFTWTGPAHDNPDIYVQQIGAGGPLRLTKDAANDHSPAWSPDGRAIAFLRRRADSFKHEVLIIPPLGGAERRIAEVTFESAYRPRTLTWCPDASCVIVGDSLGPGTSPALFAITIDGGRRRQLTFPPGNTFLDNDPAISSDRRWLVFRRDRTPFTSELHRVELDKNLAPTGESVLLTDVRVNGSKPVWMPNGRDIVYAARGALWRLDAFSGGAPARLPYIGLDGFSPAVSAVRSDGTLRLVYARNFSDTNIWRIDTPGAGQPAASPPRVAIASTRIDYLPNLSPDGKHLAFLSSRSGEEELWVSDPDGANQIQVTSLMARPGFARWSPDSQSLVFHSDPDGRPDVLVIGAQGGTPRVVTRDTGGGGYPSFSHDGRWIYFNGPDAPNQFRIFRMPVDGGRPTRMVDSQSALGLESADGRDVFYVEAAERPSILWRQPIAGGPRERLFDGIVDAAFDVVKDGIYFLEQAPAGRRVQYYGLATRRITSIATDLGTVGLGLTVSRDGRIIFFTRIDSSSDELMLVDSFR